MRIYTETAEKEIEKKRREKETGDEDNGGVVIAVSADASVVTIDFSSTEDQKKKKRREKGCVDENMGSSLGGLTSAWLGEWSSVFGELTGGFGGGRLYDTQIT